MKTVSNCVEDILITQPYLEEALSIMKDMIKLEDSFAAIEQKLESSQN